MHNIHTHANTQAKVNQKFTILYSICKYMCTNRCLCHVITTHFERDSLPRVGMSERTNAHARILVSAKHVAGQRQPGAVSSSTAGRGGSF